MARSNAFGWDSVARRYRDPSTGRFVTWGTVKDWVEKSLDRAGDRAEALTRQLQRREVSLAGWEAGMRDIVRQVHGYSAVIAKGGYAQMRPADWGRVGAQVREQLAYLRNRAKEVASGKQPLDGSLVSRARMYADSGNVTYHLVEREEMRARGYDQERSILTAGENCQTCEEEEEKDWQPLGEMIPIGERRCKSRCRCRVQYRKSHVLE